MPLMHGPRAGISWYEACDGERYKEIKKRQDVSRHWRTHSSCVWHITNALYTSSQTSYIFGHFKEINFPFENMHGMSLGQKSGCGRYCFGAYLWERFIIPLDQQLVVVHGVVIYRSEVLDHQFEVSEVYPNLEHVYIDPCPYTFPSLMQQPKFKS